LNIKESLPAQLHLRSLSTVWRLRNCCSCMWVSTLRQQKYVDPLVHTSTPQPRHIADVLANLHKNRIKPSYLPPPKMNAYDTFGDGMIRRGGVRGSLKCATINSLPVTREGQHATSYPPRIARGRAGLTSFHPKCFPEHFNAHFFFHPKQNASCNQFGHTAQQQHVYHTSQTHSPRRTTAKKKHVLCSL